MYTQCPNCRKTYPLTTAQLRESHGDIYCTQCEHKFNALDKLTNEPQKQTASKKSNKANKKNRKKTHNTKRRYSNPEISSSNTESPEHINTVPCQPSLTFKAASSSTKPIPAVSLSTRHPTASEAQGSQKIELLPWEKQNLSIKINWLILAISLSSILIGQLLYFELPQAIQNPNQRIGLEKICQWLGCKLPLYENSNELEILQGSLIPDSYANLKFKTVITNQAAFRQKLPFVKLILVDFNEQTFAERIFSPADYQTQPASSFIAPEASIEITLMLATPAKPIGGYYFDLSY